MQCKPHTGCIEVYSSLRTPLDLCPILPKFQLDFGHTATLPYVKLGLHKHIGQFSGKTYCKVLCEQSLNSAICIAELQPFYNKYDLEFLIKFDV